MEPGVRPSAGRHRRPGRVAGVALAVACALAGCGASAAEVDEVTAQIELGPGLTAALSAGPLVVNRGTYFQPPYAERPVRLEVPAGVSTDRTPVQPRDRVAPKSAAEIALCERAVEVFAAAGYQLLSNLAWPSALLDARSCPVAELAGLQMVADEDLPAELRVGAPAPAESDRLRTAQLRLLADGTGTLSPGSRPDGVPVRLTDAELERERYLPVLDGPLTRSSDLRPGLPDAPFTGDLRVALPPVAPAGYSLTVTCRAIARDGVPAPLGAASVLPVLVRQAVPQVGSSDQVCVDVGPAVRHEIVCDGAPHTVTGSLSGELWQLDVAATAVPFARGLTYDLSPV